MNAFHLEGFDIFPNFPPGFSFEKIYFSTLYKGR